MLHSQTAYILTDTAMSTASELAKEKDSIVHFLRKGWMEGNCLGKFGNK